MSSSCSRLDGVSLFPEPDGDSWFLYALRCADGTIYAGVTTDLDRRMAEHNTGRGARYTAGRRPVHPIAAWRFPDRGTAQRAEAHFRRLSREGKLTLIARREPFAGADFCLPSADAGADRFCPRCGEALKTSPMPGDERSRQVCTGCGRVHYRNAKPCTGALVTRNGRVLLVKRAIQPYQGCWDIPGGFLEADEHPEAGAVREVQEETGLDIQLTGLLGFYVDRYTHDAAGEYCLNIYFLAQAVGGQECPAEEATEIAWFAPDDLPDEIAFEHTHLVLADWVQWLEGEPA
ncbi:MAG TPA: NUDIX domain-containing protein [Chloroflexi bacterium]|nr:NUDIX domain-containing protein [Chloroflexota bacterium]